jgi:hypothetical protein
MPLFDDMVAAVENYPVDDVVLEIVDVALPGNVLNVSEEATFKVKITNNGPLNMTDVTLRVKGQHGTRLKLPLGPIITSSAPAGAAAVVVEQVKFVEELVSKVLPAVNAHGGAATTETFTLKAPDTDQVSQILIKATLEDWNVNLLHILNGHSDPLADAPKGTYSTAVVQS